MNVLSRFCFPQATSRPEARFRSLVLLTVIVGLLAVVPDWHGSAFAAEGDRQASRQVDDPSAMATPAQTPTAIQITSIIANLVIRLAAVAAGLYVVWLGHQSLLSGIKGDFEFEGPRAKLKGSSPGLLFVLLGCLAIGWALQAKHTGDRTTQVTETSEITGQTAPPPVPPMPVATLPPSARNNDDATKPNED